MSWAVSTVVHAIIKLMFQVRLMTVQLFGGVQAHHTRRLFGAYEGAASPSARLVALGLVLAGIPTPKFKDMREVVKQLQTFYATRSYGSLLGGGEHVERDCFDRCHWVTKGGASKARGVVLYTHGGGYVSGTFAAYREACGEVSRRTGCAVLFVDYALAPAVPISTQREQVLRAYRWLLEAEAVAPAKVAVMGDSAGGGLGLALLQDAAGAGLPQPCCAVLASPWADLTNASASMAAETTPDIIFPNRDFFTLISEALVTASGKPAAHPSNSALFGSFEGLAPLLVTVGSSERLLDDCTRVAAKAKEAGVPVETLVEPFAVHNAALLYSFGIPEHDATLANMCTFVRRHLDAKSDPALPADGRTVSLL